MRKKLIKIHKNVEKALRYNKISNNTCGKVIFLNNICMIKFVILADNLQYLKGKITQDP